LIRITITNLDFLKPVFWKEAEVKMNSRELPSLVDVASAQAAYLERERERPESQGLKVNHAVNNTPPLPFSVGGQLVLHYNTIITG